MFRSTPSWNTVVSTSRPHSTSPSPKQRLDRSPSSTKNSSSVQSTVNTSKPVPLMEQQCSLLITNGNETKNDQAGLTDVKQKPLKKQKNKTKPEPPPSLPSQSPTSETVSFVLDDENAFPTLGQDVSIPPPQKIGDSKREW